MTFHADLATDPLIAILRGEDPDRVTEAAIVLVDAGIRHIEVTFTVPRAEEVIAQVIEARPDAYVGAGTVREPSEVRRAQGAGARFLVSPGATSALLEEMVPTGLPVLPGVFTAGEAMLAAEAGCSVLKLFPAATGGVALMKQLMAPLPDLRFVPSGGIGLGEIAEWLKAGALGVGLGSLVTARDLETRDWESVRAKVEQGLAAVRAARPGSGQTREAAGR